MAATSTDAERRSRPTLISGHKMKCPRCKKERDILAFKRMEEIEEFAHETTPIYKCPPRNKGGCGWEFAPSDHAVLKSINPDGVPAGIRFE